MNKIIGTSLLFCLMIQVSLTGQRCDDVIFPGCPGSGGTPPVPPAMGNRTPVLDSCSHTILQQPQHGNLSVVTTAANANVDGIFFYNPTTNCFAEDMFVVLECCPDTLTGQSVCEEVVYMLHLSFECETPSDKFCCIQNNGQLQSYPVLENDQEAIMQDYPGSAGIVDIQNITAQPIGGIVDVDQANGALIYAPQPGFIGVDSVSYEVVYTIANGDLIVCDTQTCYFIVEDCGVAAIEDQYIVAVNDTICFDATMNDIIQQPFETFCPEGLECQNPLPEIDPLSFELLNNPNNQPPDFYPTSTLATWCFTSPVPGTFSYDYFVCNNRGDCGVSTIIVEVTEFCPPDIETGQILIQSGIYHAGQILISNGFVPDGNNVAFRAGEGIFLEPGFSVAPQADFAAQIQPCIVECWDINQNGFCEGQEDINGDGVCDDTDCE